MTQSVHFAPVKIERGTIRREEAKGLGLSKEPCSLGFGGMTVSWLKKLRERTEATVRQLNTGANPRTQMDAVIAELEQQIAQVQTQLAQYMGTANQFRERFEETTSLVEKRQSEAVAALQSGQDALARRALDDQAHLGAQSTEFKRLWEQADETIGHLRRHLDELQVEQLRLKEQRDQLVTRADSADLERQLADLKSGLDSRARSFEKMEEMVQNMEVTAKAHREVANWPQTPEDNRNKEVETRLEALRRQLEQGS